MRAPARFLLGACGAIAVGALPAACDWRAFDTLQNQAPVLAIDAPSGFPSSSDFGSVLLPVAPPADGSSAAWFLASATEMTGLALIKLDASGGSSALTLTGQALDELGESPVTAMAEIPGTGTAFLGAPTLNSLLTVDLATQTVSAFVLEETLLAPETELGVGVAAGKLIGGATPDLVATSSTSLHVFVAGAVANELVPSPAELAACQMMALSPQLASGDKINRAVVIGNLTGSGSVVAVGTPGAGVAGSVSIFEATASAITCVGVLLAPAVTSPAGTVNSGFGRALAIGDFDGDGAADLLVGAPPDNVYLYKGPLAFPVSAPTATIPAPSSSAAFGAAMAAIPLDGVKGDEALVSDPGASIDGQTGAGNVTIYTGATLSKMATPTPVLTDHESSTGEAYGSALGALPFCASPPCATGPQLLPLVGTPSKAFVYFTLGPTDPRAM
jgi:hypothetical protein